MMDSISLRQLRVFVAIAATESARIAAEQLNVTQPAVSMALAELERQLDAKLFDRHKGRLRLNARGKEALPIAQEILERLREMVRTPDHDGIPLHGELHIGTSNTVGNYLVGDLLGPFVHRHPDVVLKVSVDNTEAIVAALLEHRIDAGCVEGPVYHPQLHVQHWREDALVVCAAPGHALTRQSVLTAGHFAEASWILREPGSATRAMAQQILDTLPRGRIVLELGQVEAIKQAVIAGLGLAFLPAAATTDSVACGRLAILHTPFLNLRRNLSLILHKDRYRGAVMDAFVDSLVIEDEAADTDPSGA